MKKILFLVLFTLSFLLSCEDGEVVTGSPVDNNQIEISTINATVSTPVTNALTGFKVPFTVTLPRTFADTVRVEATTLSKTNTRRRAYVDVMPGQTTATGEVLAVGGILFNSTFDLFLSAIELKSVEQGKHYLLDSNVITINTGNTTVPDDNSNQLQIKLTWVDAGSTKNDLRFVIDRPDPVANANITNIQGTSKFHNITTADLSSPNSVGTSNASGDYILKITARKLLSTPLPSNIPYRLVIKYPNGKVELYEGVYENLFADDLTTTTVNEESPLKDILLINKSIVSGNAVFTVTQL